MHDFSSAPNWVRKFVAAMEEEGKVAMLELRGYVDAAPDAEGAFERSPEYQQALSSQAFRILRRIYSGVPADALQNLVENKGMDARMGLLIRAMRRPAEQNQPE